MQSRSVNPDRPRATFEGISKCLVARLISSLDDIICVPEIRWTVTRIPLQGFQVRASLGISASFKRIESTASALG